jgi:TRAP-type mannitol/chloroaromatic compound transport system substrate-binding protein
MGKRRDSKWTTLRRRDVLIGAGSLTAVSAPAIAQGLRQLKMVTDWPAGSPGLQSSASRLAQRISAASAGRINIEMYPAGALVRSRPLTPLPPVL